MGKPLQSTPDEHRAFVDGLRAGFIDYNIDVQDDSAPQFLTNDAERVVDVLSQIKRQMSSCLRFDFAVAFITDSGLQTLVDLFSRMRKQGISGRILTSTYQNFNKPDALEKLLEYDNIQVRVYQGNMHAKGYFFDQGTLSTLIVGSANLTQTALCENKEWNLLIHSYPEGALYRSATDEFERLWNAPLTVPVTEEWVSSYREFLKRKSQPTSGAPQSSYVYKSVSFDEGSPKNRIMPNDMQNKALKSLEQLRVEGQIKALLVSATGTGKTYLAALDVAQAKPKRVLFVVHRERILNDAKASFENVLGDAYQYGLYSGSRKDRDASCLFAMSTTLSGHLGDFDSAAFDYIIIDEAHHSAAKGHRAILEHFNPRFLLGMTATPNRTDGSDIYSLYDNNIAYKISLRDALESQMLVPFHYFGIQDLVIDDEELEDTKLFARLTSEERVNHIIEKIEEYSVGRRGRKGLIFCSRKEEAKTLAAMFRERGYRAQSLTGDDDDAKRERTIRLLENSGATDGSDYLEYVFTVDIFNEGVDIPALNQVIMLRPTESAIIFVQQLGRGLRKCKNPFKEYTLVLDFIGNYRTNYLIPVALSGDRTYNKDAMRVFVKEGSATLRGCSTISFDEVSEKRVLESIDSERFSTVALIKEEYSALRNELGGIPSLMDFDTFNAVDPLLIFNNHSLGSYHSFLKKYEKEYNVSFTPAQESILEFISLKLAAGKRPHELFVLKQLIEQNAPRQQFATALEQEQEKWTIPPAAMSSVQRVLTNQFPSSVAQRKYSDCVLVTMDGDEFALSEQFSSKLEDEEFRRQVLEVIEFGLHRFEENYSDPYQDTDFQLYRKYTYEDVCRLLGWARNETPLNIGGYKYDKETNTFPVFINYEKAPDISDTTKYEDRFISPSELVAISKQGRTLSSKDIRVIANSKQTDTAIYLFVRKNKDDSESKEFYFLGRIFPTGDFREITLSNTTSPAVEIRYRLDVPVRADLYDYFTTRLDDE